MRWLEDALTKPWGVLDVENYFWASRTKNDIPDMPDGTPFKVAQAAWEAERGSEVKYRRDLGTELREWVDRWQDYCFAIGFQTPGGSSLIWSEHEHNAASRDSVTEFIRAFVGGIPVVAHNSTHDVRVVKKNFGIGFDEWKRVDDSMLLHNCYYSELPHDLNFVSGTMSSQNRHKQLGTHSAQYLQGDVWTTAECWHNLKRMVSRDQQTWNVYETLQRPLLPTLLEAHEIGIRLDYKFMAKLKVELQAQRDRSVEVANKFVQEFTRPEKKNREGKVVEEAILADPKRTINLNSSPQLNDWMFRKCGLSIKGMRKGKSGLYSTKKDVIAALQDQFWPREDDDTFEYRLSKGGHPLVEAKGQFSQADNFLSGYINPYLGEERCYPHFNISAQATGRWSTTGPNIPGANKQLKPMFIPDPGEVWVGGDWSNAELRIMAEISDDAALKKGFGEDWDLHSMHASQAFGWDSPRGRFEWALELRKIKGEFDEWAQGKEFARGLGWWGRVAPTDWKKVKVPADFPWEQWIIEGGPQPGWLADDDPFRRFCKILIFRLMYGGSVDSAGAIPGAVALGLPTKRLVRASKDLILAHPCWQEFWNDYGGKAKEEKIVRNWNGRARRLMSTQPANRFREGVNHPIQSTVSDLLNRTVVTIKERAPWSRLVYTIHDSLYFGCEVARKSELASIVNEVAELPIRGSFYVPFDMDCVSYDEGSGDRRVEKL